MKYSYLILLGLLALAPATYAEDNGNADQMSMTQPGNITVKGKVVDENGELLPGANVQEKVQPTVSLPTLKVSFLFLFLQMLR